MSYGPNFPALFRRTADFVDKILRGAKPGNMPVEQPTKFDLVVDLTTAKALQANKLLNSFLSLADEVIGIEDQATSVVGPRPCGNSTRYNRTRNFEACGHAQSKKMQKFLLRSALQPN